MKDIKQIPILKESQFAVYYFDEENKILFQMYKHKSYEKMSEKCFKKECQIALELSLDRKVESFITDTRYFNFIISPNLRQWTNTNFFEKHQYVQKFAIINSLDIIGQISLFQTFNDFYVTCCMPFSFKFFNNIREAFRWVEK